VIFGHQFGHELMPADASSQQDDTRHANLAKTNLQVASVAGDYGSRGCRFESCRARVYFRSSGHPFRLEQDRYLASRRSWSTYQLVVTLAMCGMAAHGWRIAAPSTSRSGDG
jgi:hypothetical protein